VLIRAIRVFVTLLFKIFAYCAYFVVKNLSLKMRFPAFPWEIAKILGYWRPVTHPTPLLKWGKKMNAEGRNRGWQKWRFQIPRTNLQRSSKAQTSNVARLVLEYSLELGSWVLDVLSLISAQSSNITPFLPKPLFVSPCAPTALNLNCGKLKAKKIEFFFRALCREIIGKSGENPPKSVAKMSEFAGISQGIFPCAESSIHDSKNYQFPCN
jgi:hypothetical protein